MDISSSRSDIFKDEWTTLLKAVADLEIAQKAGNFRFSKIVVLTSSY